MRPSPPPAPPCNAAPMLQPRARFINFAICLTWFFANARSKLSVFSPLPFNKGHLLSQWWEDFYYYHPRAVPYIQHSSIIIIHAPLPLPPTIYFVRFCTLATNQKLWPLWLLANVYNIMTNQPTSSWIRHGQIISNGSPLRIDFFIFFILLKYSYQHISVTAARWRGIYRCLLCINLCKIIDPQGL